MSAQKKEQEKLLRTAGVTAAEGFSAGGIAAGIKESGLSDLALVVSQYPCTAAGVFTTNAVRASCVDWCSRNVSRQPVRAIVANSGNANACTGKQGAADTRRMAREIARECDARAEQVLVASTGVIGHFLPMDKIADAVPALAAGLRPTARGGAAFARAIMTTDTRPKQAALTTSGFTVGGCAKGSGMIHPNMATMLGFVTTDAAVAPKALDRILHRVVDKTFNNLTIDGDTSTNDMVLVCANGMASSANLSGAKLAAFEAALYQVCNDLCAQLAADGEGASKRIEVRVAGARNAAEATQAAKAIAGSNLVKTAVFGNDPNWGRILCAIGYSGASFSKEKISVAVCGLPVCEALRPVAFPQARMRNLLHRKVVTIEAHLGRGTASAVAHTCDLTYDYVRINAEYTT